MIKKPFRVLEERFKNNYIEIALFKKRKTFSFTLNTSIGDGGIGFPHIGSYESYNEAKNAALRCVLAHHKSTKQLNILRKFRLIEDIDQPYLFDEL